MSEKLPSTLKSLHEDARSAKARTDTFLSYINLMNKAYKEFDQAKNKSKLADRHLNAMKAEHTFYQRHTTKIDALYVVLPECFSSPTKVMRNLDEMVMHYPAEYVFEVCKLGAWRIGPANGWTFFGFKSMSRIEAELAYEQRVLPIIAQMLADHRDYIELRQRGVEEAYDLANEDATEKRFELAAIEAVLPVWRDEMKAAATALTQDEVDRLTPDEREVRRRLMPSQLGVENE